MAVKDWVASILTREAAVAFDPRGYWEDRHHELVGKLSAVGHRCLTEEANAEQYALKLTHIREAILRHRPTTLGGTLLEAGCGTGCFTPHFVDLGFEVTAVDFSPSAVAQARMKAPTATFHVSALRDLDLGEKFDVVAIVDVLLHIVDDTEWHKTLGVLATYLKTGGVLILMDTLVDDPHDAPHCRHRPLDVYLQFFESMGIELVEHERFLLAQENAEKDLTTFRKAASSD